MITKYYELNFRKIITVNGDPYDHEDTTYIRTTSKAEIMQYVKYYGITLHNPNDVYAQGFVMVEVVVKEMNDLSGLAAKVSSMRQKERDFSRLIKIFGINQWR